MSTYEPPPVSGTVIVSVKHAHPEWVCWHSEGEQTIDLAVRPGLRVHLTGTAVQLSNFLADALAAVEWEPPTRVDVVSHRFAPSYVDEMDQAGDHQHRDIEDGR